MSENRMSKKELTAPDPVELWLYNAVGWMMKHRRQLITGAIVFLLLLLVGFGLYKLMEHQDEQKALEFYQTQKSVDALLNEAQKQPEKVMTGLNQFIQEHPDTHQSVMAQLQVASLYANAKQWDKAIEAYNKVLKHDKATRVNLHVSRLALASIHEHRQEYGQAINYLNEISDVEWADIRMSNLARIHEKSGNTQQAIDLLEQLIKQVPDSPYVRDAEATLLTLNSSKSG